MYGVHACECVRKTFNLAQPTFQPDNLAHLSHSYHYITHYSSAHPTLSSIYDFPCTQFYLPFSSVEKLSILRNPQKTTNQTLFHKVYPISPVRVNLPFLILLYYSLSLHNDDLPEGGGGDQIDNRRLFEKDSRAPVKDHIPKLWTQTEVPNTNW